MIIKFGIYRTNYSPRFFKHLGDMEEQNENLTLAFNESIDKQDIVELGQNIGDVTIDMISNSDVVSTIPILGLLNGAYKVYKSVSAGRLMKKVYFYLFQTQKFSREEKEKFLREYASEGHDNGAEMLLDLIRRLDNGNKITILCNLINYRVNEHISMTDFMRLTSSLERVPITDLRFLNNYTSENNINGVNDSLLSAGLIYESTVNVGKTPLFRLNYSGYQMLRYGLDNHDINIPENFPKNIPGFITAVDVDNKLSEEEFDAGEY